MQRKAFLIAGGILLVGAFLIGFVPQYRKAGELESQLATNRKELSAERLNSQLDELGLLIGRVYLEANLKNYGTAGQYSTKFFNRVRAMADQARTPKQKAFLQTMLAKRDAVTSGLAKGDAGAVPVVRDLFRRTLEATETGSN